MGSKIKSLIYLIPVAAPLLVMLSFPPKIVIQAVSYHLIGSFSVSVPQGPIFFSPFQLIQPPLQQTMVTIVTLSTNQIFSITGIICVTGLALGGVYAVITILLGDWIASRLLHIINLESNEYDWLQTEITKISKKLSISTPQVALVEDLRPNAFTMGNGRKTKIVFTIGLLNILDKEEILAVASHELAHVKNHDFLFKVLSNSLTAVSFFNPLAYFAFFNSQREREMLADENGVKLLQNSDSLAKALTRITKALQNLPSEGKLIRLTSNLLVTSPIIHRPQILSSHPKINFRLRNINQLTTAKPKGLKLSKLIVAIVLTCVIIIAGATTTYALANLQSGYVTPKMVLTGSAYVKGVSTDSMSPNIVLISSNLTFDSIPDRVSSWQNPNPYFIPPYLTQQIETPNFDQNQAECITHETPPTFREANPPDQISIIYALANENGAALIIKA